MRVVSGVEKWLLGHRLMIARNILVGSLAVLVLLALGLFTRNVSVGSQSDPAILPATPTVGEDEFQLIVLEAQLEQMQRTDERLLQTVYWALGSLVGIGAALIALSWFTNIRMSERDRVSLRQEIVNEVTKEREKASQRVEEAIRGLDQAVRDEVSNRISQYEREQEQQFSEIRRSMAITHSELLAMQATEHLTRGNYGRVLKIAQKMLAVSLGADHDDGVGQSLHVLQTVLPQRFPMDPTQVAELNDLLEKVPEKFVSDVAITRNRLTAARNRSSEVDVNLDENGHLEEG